MSDISQRLMKAIAKKDISYGELQKLTGIPKSALQRYATGETVKIPLKRLELLADALGVSAAYLMGWEEGQEESLISPEGQMIGILFDRASDMDKMLTRSILDKYSEKVSEPPQKIIPLFGTSAAAGPGEMDTGNPWEDYSVQMDSKAEFAVRISGDSMEPVLHDGQIALCTKERPDVGDVAIVMINGALLVKQFITDGRNVFLRSINRDRKDCDYDIWATGNDTVQCYGTVILKKRPPLVDQ